MLPPAADRVAVHRARIRMSFARAIAWGCLVCAAVAPVRASTRLVVPVAGGGDGTVSARALRALESLAPPVPGRELVVDTVRWSPSGPHVRVQQRHAGVPIWRAEAVVSFDAELQPTLVASDVVGSDFPATAPEGSLPAAPAITLALAAVGAHASMDAPPQATLFWRRDASAGWLLAWRARFACAEPPGDWEVWIDARSSAVIDVADRTLHHAEPSIRARVFLPDPVSVTGDRTLHDSDDADAAIPPDAYAIVPLAGLDAPVDAVQHLAGAYVVLEDWEAPHMPPATSAAGTFLFTRSASGFEDAMVYFHIDAVQRWFQQLGFHDANNRRQPADSHGLDGLDNSKYVPSLRKLAFGDGGVDDAEDASVIVHEYAHAVQHDIVPTWGDGGHTRAMGEGFGDYLANSYAYALQPERTRAWNGVFLWDGHNEFWPGRPALDPTLAYPRDAELSPHRSGTLWCSILTDVLYTLGDRAIADRLILDHHYALTGSATMLDAANAILVSDAALYGGAHTEILQRVFRTWGLPVTLPPAGPSAVGRSLVAWPNPFNPSTTLRYDVQQAGIVELDVYDLRGRLVRRLLRQHRAAGRHTLQWDGRTEAGELAASGTYLLCMRTPAYTVSRKLTLMR